MTKKETEGFSILDAIHYRGNAGKAQQKTLLRETSEPQPRLLRALHTTHNTSPPVLRVTSKRKLSLEASERQREMCDVTVRCHNDGGGRGVYGGANSPPAAPTYRYPQLSKSRRVWGGHSRDRRNRKAKGGAMPHVYVRRVNNRESVNRRLVSMGDRNTN